ncbi:hypothetical protein HPB50_028471 [Hyalomma asiaticum]|nr:hypothetical protein HPB50_028471 [Hyalomma asiaticum]
MPKVTKVKYVTKELPAEDYDLLWENQQIAKEVFMSGTYVTEDVLYRARKPRQQPLRRETVVRQDLPSQHGGYIQEDRVDQARPQAFAMKDEKGDRANDKISDDEDLFIYTNRPTFEDFDDRS